MTDKEIKIYYPIKYEPRQIQLDALEHTKHNIRRGKKFIMLNLPTGSGKSMFSVMFINWYLNYINKDAKFDILTNSKILQNQYVDEFPFMSSLKGKGSYNCLCFKGMSCEEASEFNKVLKKKCVGCPYDMAKESWISSRVGLTNFHLFNTLSLFVPEIIETKKSNVLLIDESHLFPDILCDFISSKISKISLKVLGFNDVTIYSIFNDIKNIKTIEDFVDYIEKNFIIKLENQISNIEKILSNPSLDIKDRIKYTKNIVNLKSSISNYNSFLSDYKINHNNWVLDIEQTEDKMFYRNFIIQPVWSHSYLEKTIWKNYDHVIMISGSLLNKDIVCYMNGIVNNKSSYVEYDSPFPTKNHSIYYMKGIGKMSFKEKINTWENQKVVLDKIIKKYKNKKGIIHTNSFEFSSWVQNYYKDNDRFIFHDSTNRDDALREHIESVKPTILVSPSISVGIDLPGKLCEFQIIIKIPYPSLNSVKIKKRMSDNKDYYGYATCTSLIQSTGRGVRSSEDVVDTFILDDSFGDLLKYNYKFLPNWFTNLIKILK